MLPGFAGEESDFDRLIAQLPGCRCQVVTAPQITDTAVASVHTQEQLAGLIQGFQQRITHWCGQLCTSDLPETFWLYGYSMGGRLALAIVNELMKIAPGRVQGLILESANPGLADLPQGCPERLARWQSDYHWAQQLVSQPLKAVFQRWYRQPVFADLSPAEVGERVVRKARLDGAQLASQMLAFSLALQPDYRRLLVPQALPVWYISGSKDRKFTEIGRQLSGLTHRVCERTGHNIHWQRPEWVAAQIVAAVDTGRH